MENGPEKRDHKERGHDIALLQFYVNTRFSQNSKKVDDLLTAERTRIKDELESMISDEIKGIFGPKYGLNYISFKPGSIVIDIVLGAAISINAIYGALSNYRNFVHDMQKLVTYLEHMIVEVLDINYDKAIYSKWELLIPEPVGQYPGPIPPTYTNPTAGSDSREETRMDRVVQRGPFVLMILLIALVLIVMLLLLMFNTALLIQIWEKLITIKNSV